MFTCESFFSCLSDLLLNPRHQYRYGVLLFGRRQWSSCWYMMPFWETASATATCCMLSDKHGMTSHGCLFSIVWNHGWSKSLGNEIFCMFTDGCQALFGNIFLVFRREMESTAEVRLGKPACILKWSNSTTLNFGLCIISQVPRNSMVYLVRIQFLMMSAARLSLCLPLAMSVSEM